MWPFRKLGTSGDSLPGRLKSTSSLTRGLQVETFEPRVLLSADLLPISGTIEFPGEIDRYTFDLAEERSVLFDSLTPNNNLRWSLTGPGGQVVSATAFTAADGAQGGGILSLGAGSYFLDVSGTGDTRGEYQFRLLDLGNARPLVPGQRVEGTLGTAGRESDVFRFDATEGQVLFFDAQVASGGTAYWQLVDPDGNTVFGPTNFSASADVARFTVGKTGTYTLLFEGYIYNSSDYNYAFTVEQVVDESRAIALDTLIAEILSQPGQRHHLTFTLDSDQRLFFDTLNGSTIRWSLSGPRGTEVSGRELRYSDWWYENPALDLVAGDYTLTIGDGSDRTGLYAFRLLTEASAEQVTFGERVSGLLTDVGVRAAQSFRSSEAPMASGAGDGMMTFSQSGPTVIVPDDPALRAQAFTFETWMRADAAGQWDSIVSAATSSWQDGWGLYLDAAANLHFFVNSYTTSASTISAPVILGEWTHVAASYGDGALKLWIDGQLVAQSAYDLPVAHSNRGLRVGTTPDTDSYRLRGALDEARLWSRALSGAEIAAGMSQRQTGPAPDLLLALGFNGTPGATLPDTAGTGLAARLSDGPGTEARLFRFDGAAGDRLLFDGAQSGNIYYRLYGPAGQVVIDRASLAVLDPLVLPEDGPYTLLIEGYAEDSVPRSFNFLLIPKASQDLSLSVGEVVSGSIAAPGSANSYAFTLGSETKLYFDSLSSNRSDVTWSLIGPRGTEISSRRFDQSDSFTLSSAVSPVLDLPPGAYTLVVDGVGAATGEYAFRLFDLGAATLLTVPAQGQDPQEVTALLDPGSATAVYAFDALAGDRISLPRVSGEAYGRLVDPFGRLVFANQYFNSAGSLTLPASGRYTLLVEGFPGATTSAAQTHVFQLKRDGFTAPPVLEGLSYTIGATLAGQIGAAGEVAQYLFTLTEPRRLYLDALDYGIGTVTNWSLTGPRGSEVSNRNLYTSDSADYGSDVTLDLPAGTYRISFSKSGTQTGSFAFRLLDLDQAVAIGVGDVVAGSLDPRSETDVFRFDAVAGQPLVLDLVSLTGHSNTPTYRLIDPFGREIRRNQSMVNATAFTPAHDGSYTLLLEGRIWDGPGGVAQYSFALRDVVVTQEAIALGETVTGSVPSARGAAEYTLTLDDPVRLVFDNLTDQPNATLVVTGAGGVSRSFNLRNADSLDSSAPPLLDLAAGDYTLRITGNQNTRPSFSFRLIDTAEAQLVTFDEAVTGTLDPARQTQVFAFEAEAGQVYTLANVTNTGGVYNAGFRLIDPFGRQIVGPTQLSAHDPRTLSLDGRYLLIVEGRIWEPEGRTVSFGFTLQDPQNPAPREVVLEERVTGEILRPGQVHQLTFDLAESTLLYLDSFTNDFNMRLRIQGPGGVDRTYRLRDADSFDFGAGNPVIKAGAGSYTITVFKDGTGTGDYDFSLRNLENGAAIAIGERVEGTLDPKRETDIFRFEANAGESFLFDVLRAQSSSHNVYWRLIDPNGNQEIGRTQFLDRDLHTLARSGIYTLLIEGRTYEAMTGAISYAFALVPASTIERSADIDAVGQFAGLVGTAGPGGGQALAFTGYSHLSIDDPATDLTDSASMAFWFRPETPSTTWTPLVYTGGPLPSAREITLWLHSSGYVLLSVGN